MTVRRIGLLLAALVALTLVACSSGAANPGGGSPATTSVETASPSATTDSTGGEATSEESVVAAMAANHASHAQADDIEYDEGEAISITLNGTSASAAGAGVEIDGSSVTVSAPGTYVISGTLTGGQIVVDSGAEGKVRLVLDGASITSPGGGAISIEAADEVVIVLAPSSGNALKDGAYDVPDDADAPNAALYSMADLTIGGTGALTVVGTSYDGIASKDGLAILGGQLTIEAADDGIRGKDYVIVEGGSVAVTSGGDGLKSDNEEEADRGYVAILGGEVSVNTAGDGIYGLTDVIIGGGTVTVGSSAASQSGDGSSAKGLKSGTSVVIGGGVITVDTADDAVHSDGDISIADGSLVLTTGDDGVHAEGTLTVTGGSLEILASYEGLEASEMAISGDLITIVSSDDGINLVNPGAAAGGPGGGPGMEAGDNNLTITGGTITVMADGDGIDVNGAVTMTGGTLIISGPTMQMNGALDADGGFDISGGTMLAAGSAGMAVAPTTTSAQGWVSVTFGQAVDKGTVIQIADGDTVIASYTTSKVTESLVFSSDAITSGETYDVYVGGTGEGDGIAGYKVGGSLSGASKVTTVTAGEHVGGGFGPGGGFPRR